MKILNVKFGNATDIGFQFPTVTFRNLNLLVGESASGKSTFLNFLFNIALKAAQDTGGILGYSRIEYEEGANRYVWELDSRKGTDDKPEVISESLWKHSVDGPPFQLLNRQEGQIKVNGNPVPTMPAKSTAIYLFREDAEIKAAHKGFTRLLRRDFAANVLNDAFALHALRKDAFQKFENKKSLETMWDSATPDVNPRLFLLKKYYPRQYESISETFKIIFPFVENLEFKDMSEVEEGIGFSGRMPMLHIKDKKLKNLIPIQNISSGMKKALLIISDVVALPVGTVYLIDEYENSLGINAINFLPTLLAEHGEGKQFIITSHHPYLINAIPVDNWIVFHRSGIDVSVKQGPQLAESYGRSKQQAFIKLLNDPFFTDGK